MECINCNQKLPTYSFKKEIVCKHCGQKYVAKNLNAAYIVALIILVFPIRLFAAAGGDFVWLFWLPMQVASAYLFLSIFVRYTPTTDSSNK